MTIVVHPLRACTPIVMSAQDIELSGGLLLPFCCQEHLRSFSEHLPGLHGL